MANRETFSRGHCATKHISTICARPAALACVSISAINGSAHAVAGWLHVGRSTFTSWRSTRFQVTFLAARLLLVLVVMVAGIASPGSGRDLDVDRRHR